MSGWRSEYVRMTVNGPQSLLGFVIFWGLCPLSFLYGLFMRMRDGLYRTGLKKSYRATVPVVSVGNLATGGTGKTPMIDFLIKYLSGRAVKCAIVSRGYGGSYRQAFGRVADADGHLLMTPHECGDEPCLLAMRNPGVPVYVARQRMLGVQAAEKDGAQLLLLDDGFQHLAVKRDLDIVLLDAQCPVGNGRVLPAGMLREPISALQRADLIVMTRSDVEIKNTLRVSAPVIHSRHQLSKRLTTLDGKDVAERDYAGKRCLAFAGIASPDAFFKALRDFDFFCAEEVALADHQEYTPEILNRLIGSCHNYDFMVTTEKDAVKLASVNFPVPCYQVGVDLVFDDISPLAGMLERIIGQCA
jgi:tetraacyldisaccharide 4'-kinase